MKISKLSIRLSTNHLTGVFSFLLIFLIATVTNFPIFKSWFGIIDDHMVIEQLQPLDHLSLFNLPQKLISDTEIGDFGSYPRYRPFYYLLKFILISVLGDWAGGYYIFRTFVQAFCCFLLFRILSPVSSKRLTSNRFQFLIDCTGLLISVGLLSLSSWADISLRLGPSELELTFGVLLTCYSLFHLLRLNTTDQFTLGHRHYLLLCVGVFIAVGSKENGLIAVIPLICMTIFHYKSVVKGSIVNLISLIFVACQTLLVLSNTMIVIARGSDLYGTPRSLKIILESLRINTTDSKFAVLIIATGLLILLSQRNFNLAFGRLSIALFLDLLFLSEGVFYTGSPDALRYQHLTQVCLLVVPSLALFGLFEYFADQDRGSHTKKFFAHALIICGLYLYLSPFENLEIARRVATSNMESTAIWRSEIDELTIDLQGSYASNIVIHLFNPDSDYERIYSTVQFVRQAGFGNSIFLKTWFDGVDNDLSRSLRTFSDNGLAKWDIQPISSLILGKTSFCLMFGVTTDALDPATLAYFSQNCIMNFSINS